MNAIIHRYRSLAVFITLTACIASAMIGAFLLRFDLSIPVSEVRHLWIALLVAIPLKLFLFFAMKLNRGWWISIGFDDAVWIMSGSAGATLLLAGPLGLIFGGAFPRSIYAIDCLLTVATIFCIRVLLRMYRETPARDMSKTRTVLIYGAGWAGAGLLREIVSNPKFGTRVAGFLDDDPLKRNEVVLGKPILGTGKDLPAVITRLAERNIQVAEVLIAMPSVTGKRMRATVAICRAANVACRTLPSVSEIIANKNLSAQVRELSVEDLLTREAVELDEPAIRESLAGGAVMITGAAGSIGSELSRQIASFGPRVLILVDRAESDLFRIDRELQKKFLGLTIEAEVADVTDPWRMDDLMRRHAIESVFHAAAYKHVPLMEAHPFEAARNNIIGTWVLAQAAYANSVRSFVLISSDKAVNPTNVMGTTKRAAELVVSSFPGSGKQNRTKFSAVRFGNVLASNGSVVQVFQEQIRNGGPVTVTHPEIRRYFMTVGEAVQLVLQSSVMSDSSETFVLEMGEPVRIVDLARNMIRLAGFVPDQDIHMEFVGLRRGEKLFEELITEGEHIVSTHHEKIRIFAGPRAERSQIEHWMSRLETILQEKNLPDLFRHLTALVPEYQVSPMWADLVAAHSTPAKKPLARRRLGDTMSALREEG